MRPRVELRMFHRLHEHEGEIRMLVVHADVTEIHLFTTLTGYVGMLGGDGSWGKQGERPDIPRRALDGAMRSLLDGTCGGVFPWPTWRAGFLDEWGVDRHQEGTLRNLWAKALQHWGRGAPRPSAGSPHAPLGKCRSPQGADPGGGMRYRERLRIVEQRLPVVRSNAVHADCLPACVILGWLRIEMGHAASYHSTHYRANQDLRQRSFVAQDLTGATFYGANLSGADFTDAILVGANFHGANLEGVSMHGADLRSADLSASHLRDTILNDSRLGRTDFSSASISGRLCGVDLRGATFANATFAWANLRGSNLTGTSLRGARIEHTDLRDAQLTSAVLCRARLRNVRAANADLSHADMAQCQIQDSTFACADTEPHCPSASFGSAIMRSARLTGTILAHCSMENVVLDDAALQCVSLQGASLVESSMKGAKVTRSYLGGADFTAADVREARFQEAILSSQTDFSRAIMARAHFSNCIYGEGSPELPI